MNEIQRYHSWMNWIYVADKNDPIEPTDFIEFKDHLTALTSAHNEGAATILKFIEREAPLCFALINDLLYTKLRELGHG